MANAKFTMKMPNKVILDSNILPQAKGLKSTFNRSEGLKTCFDFDNIYPVYWEELSPGDHFEFDVSAVCRLMPTIAPVMDNVKLKFFAFWVPDRLLWKHFLNFMGQKDWQEDKGDYLMPQLNLKDSSNVVGGLADYLGIYPTGTTVDEPVSALPFRAYNKIYNDWFIAPELQEPIKEYSGDNLSTDPAESKDTLATYKILKKGKPLDYFTSCLPYSQAGEEVMIPLTGNAPVYSWKTDTIYTGLEITGSSANGGPGRVTRGISEVSSSQIQKDGSNLFADMSQVTGVSIEALRKASALQVLLERDARAGQRYSELVKYHYGVTCPDFLLGRSQYLGSSEIDIIINPVVQNSSTNEVSPQGHLTGIGVGQGSKNLCEVSAVEHGIFMVLACASSDVTYQQGLPRKFSKVTRYDYMNPAFWNLGDQAVYNKEIFLSTDKAINNAVFGYQERYRELREGFNKITGKMRSGVEGSLDAWHLSEKFENLPKLNGEFIKCATPIDRVISVKNEPQIIMDAWFNIKATMCLPVTSNPSLLVGRL